MVDADVCAHAGAVIERSFSDAELPRVAEATGCGGSKISARLEFSQLEGKPAIDGMLSGTLATVCQRCMKPAMLPVSERFRVIVVAEERADEPGGYEPIVADASRLDLRWVVEEQALLAMPLVPMHEPGACADAQESAPQAADDDDEGARQTPFKNLRDMLRKQ